MPSYKEVLPDSPYAKVELVKKGSIAVKQVISNVYLEEVGKDKDQKLVAWFVSSDEVKGSDKHLVLNKTNARIIADHTGSDDYDTWKDIPVELIIIHTSKPDGTPTEGIQLKILKK